MQSGTAMGNIAISIPAKVPTPFPPLNPAKIVYVWPRTAQNPHNICKSPKSGSGVDSKNILAKKDAGSHPLSTSKVMTITAGFQPKTRKTLVPPALPLPCSRMSIPLVSFPMIILVGNEPMT
ncbi:uncharacterized protein METZ01_LOCUS144952 [marine metagenome]|uniref:Uncharacterized protein n=1 Tax=marine metagenome TaxID=408172 RepID=A0A381ZS35_9ZZZZ